VSLHITSAPFLASQEFCQSADSKGDMVLEEVPRMAHQIINLVGSVVGRAEMLLEEMEESDPMREDLVKMIRAGHEAAGLTRVLADMVGPGSQSELVR
jgi:hypothetical protein